MGIHENQAFQFHIAYFYSVMEVKVRYVYVDVVGHIFGKAIDFQRFALAYKGTTFSKTGSYAYQTQRYVHLHFAVF